MHRRLISGAVVSLVMVFVDAVRLEFMSSSHRLAIYLLLQCDPSNFFHLEALVCSSWVHINKGTSRRSYLVPEGDTTRPGIRAANRMASRPIAEHVIG